jgi:hypothetical protein
MSLLHQDAPEELDDAARGEELTKGTSHVVVASVIATIVVTILVAVYVIAGQKPPLASGEVLAVWVHPQHTETSGFDANGDPVARENFDQVMVFAQVRLHNQSEQPLFLSEIVTNATLADGIHSSYAATAADYSRIFLAYPGIPVPHGKALPLETTLDPGQTVEGTFVSAFKMTKEQWDARKSLNFTFAFRYEPNLVLTPHAALIER